MFESFGVGLTLPQLGDHVTRDAVRAFCERAEALGFASLWVQEHLFYALEPSAPYAARPGMPVPEAYKTTWSPLELLTAAAAWTERVRIGTGILVGGYHRPVELAQRLATLDHLSNGRLIVGLSVGWSKDEHDQMDVEFTTRGRRMDELVEALEVCWGPDPVRSTASSSTSPSRSSAPSRCSGRARRCCRACAPRPGCAARRRCSTCGTRRRVRSSRSRRPPPRSMPCDRDGAAPIQVVQRIFTEPPFVVAGLEPMTVEQIADAVRAAREAGIAHVVVDTVFTTQVELPRRLGNHARPAGPSRASDLSV